MTSDTFMTSLNMPGFSLTVLLLPRADEAYKKEAILGCLDATTGSTAWKPFSTPPLSIDTSLKTQSSKQQLSAPLERREPLSGGSLQQ